jgi:hypothetical protein
MQHIKINSIWVSSTHVKFVVTDVTTDEQGTWIHYTNRINGNSHNCLVDAFLKRFSQELN